MLFHVTWEYTDSTEAAQKRTLQLFSKWQAGPGQFQAFYEFAEGGGGVAFIEVGGTADLAKTLAPWTAFMRFTARPILPIQEAAEIQAAAIAWRDAQ